MDQDLELALEFMNVLVPELVMLAGFCAWVLVTLILATADPSEN